MIIYTIQEVELLLNRTKSKQDVLNIWGVIYCDYKLYQPKILGKILDLVNYKKSKFEL